MLQKHLNNNGVKGQIQYLTNENIIFMSKIVR